MLDPAAQSEDDRGGTLRLDQREPASGHRQARGRCGGALRVPQRGHVRVPGRRAEQAVLHRGELAHAARARRVHGRGRQHEHSCAQEDPGERPLQGRAGHDAPHRHGGSGRARELERRRARGASVPRVRRPAADRSACPRYYPGTARPCPERWGPATTERATWRAPRWEAPRSGRAAPEPPAGRGSSPEARRRARSAVRAGRRLGSRARERSVERREPPGRTDERRTARARAPGRWQRPPRRGGGGREGVPRSGSAWINWTNAGRPLRVPPVFSARMATLDRAGIERLIPHRDPFLLIDRVTELEPGVRAVADHTFTGKEWYQPGHFPGNPIVPGVIVVESMAQTASVMALAKPEYRDGLGLFAGIEEMRFKRMVKPGDTARFVAEIDKMRRGFARVKVRTLVGDELAAEGVILAIFQPRPKEPA